MILRPPPFRMPNAVCLYVRVRVCVRVHKCAHNLRPPEDRWWLLFALSGCQAAAQVLRLTMENGSPMRIKFGVSCCAATPAEPARPLRRCDVNFFCATGSLFSHGFRCATERRCRRRQRRRRCYTLCCCCRCRCSRWPSTVAGVCCLCLCRRKIRENAISKQCNYSAEQ